jgi:hypothetical protein
LHGYQLTGLQLEAIGPTLLNLLGVDVPDSMMGQPISLPMGAATYEDLNGTKGVFKPARRTERDYTDKEVDEITKQLSALGYAV